MHLNLKIRDPIAAAFVAFGDRLDVLVREGTPIDEAFVQAWQAEVAPRWTADRDKLRRATLDDDTEGLLRLMYQTLNAAQRERDRLRQAVQHMVEPRRARK